MKDSGAIIVQQEGTLSWTILFQSLQEFSATRCSNAGIPAFFNAAFEPKEGELSFRGLSQPQRDELQEWLATQDHKHRKHLLVLEAHRLYITSEEIESAYLQHKMGEAQRTLFTHPEVNSSISGWYTAEALHRCLGHEKMPLAEEFPVGNLTAVTTAASLAEASEHYRTQIIQHHREMGVHIPLDHGVMIGTEVVIGAETTVLPGTLIKGRTTIGSHCEIGPNSQINHSRMGDKVRFLSSVMDRSVLEDEVTVGPMANIRYHCHLHQGVKVGDFVELKNATIGSKTSVAHLSYLGDCTVGSGCNFGCGSTTVNYDGNEKYRTTIGDNVFVGCNCSMIAPLSIGDGAYTAAGSVLTDDVPPGALAIARSRQTTKPEWNKKRGLFQK